MSVLIYWQSDLVLGRGRLRRLKVTQRGKRSLERLLFLAGTSLHSSRRQVHQGRIARICGQVWHLVAAQSRLAESIPPDMRKLYMLAEKMTSEEDGV